MYLFYRYFVAATPPQARGGNTRQALGRSSHRQVDDHAGFRGGAITPIQLLRTLGLLVVRYRIRVASLFPGAAPLVAFRSRTGLRPRSRAQRPVQAGRARSHALAAGTLRVQYDYRSGSFSRQALEAGESLRAPERRLPGDGGRDRFRHRYGLGALLGGRRRCGEYVSFPAGRSCSPLRTLSTGSMVACRAPSGRPRAARTSASRSSFFRTERRVKHHLPDRSILHWARLESDLANPAGALFRPRGFIRLKSSIEAILAKRFPASAAFELAEPAVESSRYLNFLVRGQFYSGAAFFPC